VNCPDLPGQHVLPLRNSCLEGALNVCLCFASDFSQGPSRQKKYQIHLKSTSGPIDVLLVNKDAWSSPPVVLPVPPPEDLIQCQAVAPSKPQIPPLAHFQEASVPSSTQPSTPTPSSTQDHSPPEQKDTSTGEKEVAESRNGMVANQRGSTHLVVQHCQLLAKGAALCLLHRTFAFKLVGLEVLMEILCVSVAPSRMQHLSGGVQEQQQ